MKIPVNKLSELFVWGLCSIACVYLAYDTGGVKIGTFLTCLFLFELWTLVNKVKNDTISEVIQIASYKMPMISFAFGAASWEVAIQVINIVQNNPDKAPKAIFLLCVLMFLDGHWFFQNKQPVLQEK